MKTYHTFKNGWEHPIVCNFQELGYWEFIHTEYGAMNSWLLRFANLETVKGHDFVLTPGRYVGFADVEDDGESFEEKMERLTDRLGSQFEQASKLHQSITTNLKSVGFDV